MALYVWERIADYTFSMTLYGSKNLHLEMSSIIALKAIQLMG